MSQRRMSPPTLIAALVVVLLALFAPPAGAVVPPVPTAPEVYVATNAGQFELVSNKLWTGAKQTDTGSPVNRVNRPAGTPFESYAHVWTSACSAKAQTASFRRTFTLYGVPSAASFQFAVDYGRDWKKNPVTGYSLLVNGIVIAKQKVSGAAAQVFSPTLDPKLLAQAFRDGATQVEVRVDRRKAPKALKKCNTKKATTHLGVTFRMTGDYQADVSLVDPAPVDVYKQAGTDNPGFVALSMRNNGPATIVGGSVHVSVCCPQDFVFYGSSTNPGMPAPAALPFTACTTADNGQINKSIQIDCALGRFRAGESTSLAFAYGLHFQSTEFTDSNISVQWRIAGQTPDPVQDNNQRSVQIFYCGTKSTKPGCATPSG